ncbi:ATP-binding protein [Collinsella ihumii]|uniref:AAA family ATPase n=1 Tax=Collinsella ihumii TaxID=1720204 RepID=A0AAW7JPS1_9ACTN|nr:ATP-binding protein [Collinsella ihumii]MDN0069554.1 AAA family ATPase [Collinsella ihumii]
MPTLVNRYPVGVQSFKDIRRRGLVYIDKTSYIWNLAHQGGKSFFLIRPRRFGKSLLISTMQAYFEGRREFFGGLDIDQLEADWEASPVIRLDMSTVKTRDVEELRLLIDRVLRPLESIYGSDARDFTPGSRLATLIERASTDSGRQVVVLVDEYDAPLLNVMDDPHQLERFREVMREFYIPLKACGDHLRFVFLTGITKFGQLSIFSELNNLRNISMDSEFAGICGITQGELTSILADDVQKLACAMGTSADSVMAELKAHYDGYRFCGDSPDIYNPFRLLNAFARGQIGSFWYESGTPTFLVNLIRQRGWQFPDLDQQEVLSSQFDAPAENASSLIALLYQAGYLTIKSYDPESRVYTLGIPNREVSQGLAESLVASASDDARDTHSAFLIKLARDFRMGDVESALERLRAYLAGIPYHLGSRDERGFETTFYLILDLLGIQIDTEFKTATGRVDAIVRSRGNVYVMEFKYGRTAAEALAQIDEKGYALPFSADEGRVVKVGVNFSPEEQTVDDWIIREG